MAEEKPLHERVASIEARCEVIVPDIKNRIEKIETRTETILAEVTTIKAMLQKNGFGKGKSAGSTVEFLKLQTKVSRWINGMLIGGIVIVLAVIGIVVAITK